ncbi:MAG TPA: prolyl oligopeptidase family serine peptidase [Bryobacteraceae bacterium]|nr:Prolyl endopeptidase [Candidatus Sulfopaludibacter sp. SbA4]HYW46769.1 prolyl oligopeptidase family serine peptidase [Bryobacteraceae bacterium]
MRMRLQAAILLTALLSGAADQAPPAPETPKRPVTDDYSGVKVVDDYRWLEQGADPEVRQWSSGQNARTRAYLDRLPMRAAIVERLGQLYNNPSPRFSELTSRGGVLFAIETQPPKLQPFLVTLASPDDPGSARVVVDPNALDAAGGTTIDFYEPSLDGKLVAVSLSKGGSEEGSVSVFDVATGKPLADAIPRVNGATAGGSVAWNGDASGFWYTRYPRAGERPEADLNFYQQVYFHHLGAAAEDEYALGRGFPPIAEIQLASSDDGKYVMARMAYGDGGQFLHYMRGPSGRWSQITRLSDKISEAAFGPDDSLYVLSRDDAPAGKLLQLMPPAFSLDKAKTVVTPGRSSIDGFLATSSCLYVRYMAGGPSKLLAKQAGKPDKTLDVGAIASVGQLVRGKGDQLLFETETFVDPPAWRRYDPASGEIHKTGLYQTSPASFTDAEVVRQIAISKDGTHVPMNIMRRKGTKLDGSNPVLLTGYGAYGISMAPGFSAERRLWLDHGGVWVLANLRGGSEFGDDWHEQGRLTKKQNVFDDFLACAEYLIKAKYTSADKLAIEGWSNGGLLMGAALVQRPELFRAVVSHVGIYDMLRVERFPNGAFNVTEFGTVKEADQFRALYGYSPYHHVKDGADYSAVLFLTGDNDGRVDPMNSRKMTARLQEATHSGRPIFLRTSASSGHGIGTALSEQIEQDADVFAFLFDQLGMK